MLTTGLEAALPAHWLLWLIYGSNELRSCSIQLIPNTSSRPRRKTALRWRVRALGVLLWVDTGSSPIECRRPQTAGIVGTTQVAAAIFRAPAEAC